MQQFSFILLVLTILIPGITLYSAESAPDEDYQKLEGKWVRNYQDGKGAPLRIEQEISNKISKVKIYDRNGKRIYSHQAKFRLQRLDDLNIFTYYDLEILEGPKKGAQQKAPQPCVYRLRGDKFVLVEGIMNGDQRPTLFVVWWKVNKSGLSSDT